MSQSNFTINSNFCISALCDDKITTTHVSQLRQHGFYTINMIVEGNSGQLLKVLNNNQDLLDAVVAKAYSLLPLNWYLSGDVIHAKKPSMLRLTTGSKMLDKALLGGVERGYVTEFYGMAGSGKTQLCMTLSVTCQLPSSKGGFEGKCIFIDTNSTFRTERIVQISKRFDIDQHEALRGIMYVPVRTSDQLKTAIDQIHLFFQSSWIPLVIIDNYASIIQTEFPGTTDLGGRYNVLTEMANRLRNLVEQYMVSVVMSNTCYAPFGASNTTVIPYGGKAMDNLFSPRLHVSKLPDSTKRTIRIHGSSLIQEQSCIVDLNEGGISD